MHTIPATSEADDARYLVRTYVLALSAGVSKVFWYEYRSDSFGLMRAEGSRRPAFAAYAAMAWLLEGKAYAGHLGSRDGTELHAFAEGDSAVVVAWAPRGQGGLAVGFPQGLGPLRNRSGRSSQGRATAVGWLAGVPEMQLGRCARAIAQVTVRSQDCAQTARRGPKTAPSFLEPGG